MTSLISLDCLTFMWWFRLASRSKTNFLSLFFIHIQYQFHLTFFRRGSGNGCENWNIAKTISSSLMPSLQFQCCYSKCIYLSFIDAKCGTHFDFMWSHETIFSIHWLSFTIFYIKGARERESTMHIQHTIIDKLFCMTLELEYRLVHFDFEIDLKTSLLIALHTLSKSILFVRVCDRGRLCCCCWIILLDSLACVCMYEFVSSVITNVIFEFHAVAKCFK